MSTDQIPEWLRAEAAEYADKAAFRVPYDGSNKFYDDNHYKWAEEAYISARMKSIEEINALKEERDTYKKALEEIKEFSGEWDSKTHNQITSMAIIALEALQPLSSNNTKEGKGGQ